MNTMLECKDILIKMDGETLLDNVSLKLKKHEMHLIVGKNGAGKTMLMKCLAGFQTYDAGEIYLDGKKQKPYSVLDAQKKGIFMIFHKSSLIPNLSVAENIFIRRWKKTNIGWIDTKEQLKAAQQMLDTFHIPIRADMLAGELGSAEQRVVEIIKAIYFNAKVLILDESLTELTDAETSVVIGVLEKIRNRGTSVVLVTHKYNKRLEASDRLSVMAKGGVVMTAEKAEVPVALRKIFIQGLERYPSIRKPTEDIILWVDHLADRFVLEDISFTARRGEVLGITGMMGSGRTCLARLLAGVERPVRGRIHYRGKERVFRSPENARESGIVYLPENNDAAIVSGFTIPKNITLGNVESITRMGRIDSKLEQLVGEEYNKRLGIEPFITKKKADELSYGAKQKVLWAKNLYSNAQLYVMDEPTKGLDSASKVDTYNIMNTVTLQGGTIIILSSNYEELVALCNRVLILRNGVINKELTEDHINAENIIKYSYEV